MVRLIRLETVFLLAIAVFGVTLVSLYQMHINDDRLDALKAVLESRKATKKMLEEQERNLAHQREKLLDEYSATKKKLQALLESVSSKQGVPEQSQQDDDSSKETAARVAEAPVDRAGNHAYPNEVVLPRKWVDKLAQYVAVEEIESSEGRRAAIDGVGNDLRPVVLQLQAVLETQKETLKHLRSKHDTIKELWPRWFKGKENKPIYRGLFALDAVMHKTHAEGLAEFQKYTLRHEQGPSGDIEYEETPNHGPKSALRVKDHKHHRKASKV